MNFYTIFQRAQLFQRFRPLQRRPLPFYKSQKRFTPESINALVPKKQEAVVP